MTQVKFCQRNVLVFAAVDVTGTKGNAVNADVLVYRETMKAAKWSLREIMREAIVDAFIPELRMAVDALTWRANRRESRRPLRPYYRSLLRRSS